MTFRGRICFLGKTSKAGVVLWASRCFDFHPAGQFWDMKKGGFLPLSRQSFASYRGKHLGKVTQRSWEWKQQAGQKQFLLFGR